MRQLLTGLLVLAALGCKASTGPAGFTLHAEVSNKTATPGYWNNTPFSWWYIDANDRLVDQGRITITSDSECITPPVAPPTTTRVMFSVPNYVQVFPPTQPDWTVTVTPVNFGTTTWSQGLAYPCR